MLKGFSYSCCSKESIIVGYAATPEALEAAAKKKEARSRLPSIFPDAFAEEGVVRAVQHVQV